MNEELVNLLSKSREVLSTVMKSKERFLPTDLHTEFEAAWPDVETWMRRIENFLQQPSAGLEEKLLSVEHGNLEEQLSRAGLSGAQLKLKVAGFGRAYANFKKFPEFKPLNRLLNWINIFIGSLSKVLPVAEIIKEFKEAVERGVKDAEEEIKEWD